MQLKDDHACSSYNRGIYKEPGPESHEKGRIEAVWQRREEGNASNPFSSGNMKLSRVAAIASAMHIRTDYYMLSS